MKTSHIYESAIHLTQVLRFAIKGNHPKRPAIAAFVRFWLLLTLCRMLKRPLRSFSLLGTELHFSDPDAFLFLLMEIFINESYIGSLAAPATILDCGSNIGMSILFFKSLWANARITGVEASPGTFALLQENVKKLPDVSLLNVAVSDRHGRLPFYSSSPNSLTGSSIALRGKGEATLVEAIPMSDLITGPLDLLKMDIEGSEIAAFSELETSGKMHLIREMFIEYHHHLPGEANSLASFLDRLVRCGFDYEIAAEFPAAYGDFQDVLIWARRTQN